MFRNFKEYSKLICNFFKSEDRIVFCFPGETGQSNELIRRNGYDNSDSASEETVS